MNDVSGEGNVLFVSKAAALPVLVVVAQRRSGFLRGHSWRRGRAQGTLSTAPINTLIAGLSRL